MSPSEQICRAIRERRVLACGYDDKLRRLLPYCHGRSTTGAESLRAVERGNRRVTTGKLWTVAKMQALRITDETFEPDDPRYNPDDSAMRHICCRI